jgi:hypothetical protein
VWRAVRSRQLRQARHPPERGDCGSPSSRTAATATEDLLSLGGLYAAPVDSQFSLNLLSAALAVAALITSVASTYYSRRQFSLMQIEHRLLVESYSRRPKLRFLLQDSSMRSQVSEHLLLTSPSLPAQFVVLFFVNNSGDKRAGDTRVNLVWPVASGLHIEPHGADNKGIDGPFSTPEELHPETASNWYRWIDSYSRGSYVGRMFTLTFTHYGTYIVRMRLESEDLETNPLILDCDVSLSDAE